MRLLLAVLGVVLLVGAVPARAEPVGEPRTVASGLAVPWEVLPLPDGRVLVPERSAERIRVIGADGVLRPDAVWSEPDANKVLGMALHPRYAENRFVYVYVTYPDRSVVLRLVDDGATLSTDRVIFDEGIATDGNHDGGRIRFGPDGKLYVTTGDIHNPALPRDLASLNGKILRLEDDGTAPADNPFASRTDDGRFVYSYGHRHPQGIAWDAQGRLWESEHGPSGEPYAPDGETSGNDEVNLIVPGGDYGWPQSSGAIVAPGTIAPAWVAGSSAVAPGGMAFAPDGRLYVPMLAGRHLRSFTPTDSGTLVDHGPRFDGTRLRAASIVGCALWFTTDKQSGATDEVRGVPITPCGAAPPPPPAPPPAADPTPVPQQPAAPQTPASRTPPALRRALDRVARELRRLGRKRAARRTRLTVRGYGFGPGRVTIRIRRGARTLAAGSARVGSRGRVTVRLRFRSAARKLARGKPNRLRLTVSHRAPGGRLRFEARFVTLR